MSNLILDLLILAHSNNRNLNAHIYWIQRYVGDINPMASAKSKKIITIKAASSSISILLVCSASSRQKSNIVL